MIFNHSRKISHEASFQRTGATRLGGCSSHISKQRGCLLHTQGTEGVWGLRSEMLCVGCVTNVFYSAIKVAKGLWGLTPKGNCHNYIPYNNCSVPSIVVALEGYNLRQKDTNPPSEGEKLYNRSFLVYIKPW